MMKLITEAFDERELVLILNAASLALQHKPTMYRICVSEHYSGALASPHNSYRQMLTKILALLAMAEESDNISFIATTTYEQSSDKDQSVNRSDWKEHLRMILRMNDTEKREAAQRELNTVAEEAIRRLCNHAQQSPEWLAGMRLKEAVEATKQ